METKVKEESKKGTGVAKKVLKTILCIILILVAAFLIHAIRNYCIVSSMQDKIAKYADSTNYCVKTVNNTEDGKVVKMTYYRKNEKQVVFLERNYNGEITKMAMYDNGQRVDTFIDSPNSKTVKLNSGNLMQISIFNGLETDNNWQTFMASAFAKISSTEYNGKDCYAVENFFTANFMNGIDKNVNYIEKDTGVLAGEIMDEMTTTRENEFDNVDDSIFIEPDISQYTLQENE